MKAISNLSLISETESIPAGYLPLERLEQNRPFNFGCSAKKSNHSEKRDATFNPIPGSIRKWCFKQNQRPSLNMS
jgi:hypothetical protein